MCRQVEDSESTGNSPLRIVVSGNDAEMESLCLTSLPQLGHEVVGHAETSQHLMELCLKCQPDLVIAPAAIGGIETAKVAHAIAKVRPVPFIVYLDSREKGTNLNSDGQIYSQLQRPVRAVQLEVEIPLVIHRFREVRSLQQEITKLLEKQSDSKL